MYSPHRGGTGFSLCAAMFFALPLFAEDRLLNEVTRLAKITDGEVGLTAIHIESNRRIALNETHRFPMASTFKVPIAVQLLSRVDRGEIRLDQMVALSRICSNSPASASASAISWS
jgi:beta-lactamase class A